ncbi:hypothetical protein GO495_02965 [Chitinophaga oryziterrae]|uniref:Uncharacterized protein n=1 Tax=Chitinophaga oryziterrae TaxID=1031224 RepID=A0A6N8J5J3_9BACT|nr:hypothetical protein [Chitinophaga oryziterrae]MVT39536.1 hypothetical protein [Chitinophaga oryziterrae]
MRLTEMIKFLLVFIILFKAVPSRAVSPNDSSIITRHPYKLMIKDIQVFVEQRFNQVDEIRFLKTGFLPKRVRSKKNQARVRFINGDFIASHSLIGHHVIEFLPIQEVDGNYRIGVICNKIEKVTKGSLEFQYVYGFSYTFRKVPQGFLVVKKQMGLPADFQ